MNKVPMTKGGAVALREELKELKQVKRPQVIDAIAEARAHGDLRENAEYHAAREQQSFIEGRIQEIDAKLSRSQVIDIKSLTPTDKVVFGATVELYEVESEVTVIYQIVGEDEADVKVKKISVTSPIARAVIGRSEGDEVTVQTPQGLVIYEINDVSYI